MEKKNKLILKNQVLNLMQIGEWKGFIDSVLEEGSNVVNIKKINGYTLLSCTAECGDKKIVEYLMQNGAKSNATNFDRSIPLHIAAKHGHVDLVDYFLNLSICVDSRDGMNRTPLHHVTDQFNVNEKHPPVLISGYDKVNNNVVMVRPCSSSQEHTELVSLLLRHGADIDATDSLGNSPLSNAVMHNCTDVVEMLIRRGADVHLLDEDQWTVLHYASYFGWLNVVQCLVERRVDLNAETLLGDTPLLLAAKRSHKEVVELLVKSGANVSSRGMLKTTALHYASREGWLDIVQLIVDCKADINARTCSGATPVMLAVKHEHSDVFDYLFKCGAGLVGCEGKTTILHYASNASWVDAVQSIVDMGSDINAQTRDGDTPLLIAASLSCKKICDILITSGASLHGYDSNSRSLLHYACNNEWIDIVRRCVDAGLDINAKTPTDMTPLMLSAFRRYYNVTIFRCLLEAGADIKLKRLRGLTVLHYACDSGSLEMVSALLSKGADVNVKSFEGDTPLTLAAYRGKTDIVLNLMEAGADVNVKTAKGNTPLLLAVHSGNTEVVLNLLSAGADINVTSSEGDTPLTLAICRLKADIALKLIEAGADVNVKTAKGNTPLLLAINWGNTHIVENLIEAGADVNVKSSTGHTPLHVAVRRGNARIVMNLLNAGADVNVNMSNGTTPLYFAVSENNFEIVPLLLRFGANCNEDNGHGTPVECYANKSNDLEYLPLFIENGAFITNNLNSILMSMKYFKGEFFQEIILKNVKACKQLILNKFNNSDLPKIYQVPFAVTNLPPMKGMKIAPTTCVAQCIEESVVRDIDKNGVCDLSVMKPIVLSFLSAKAFIDHYI